MRIAERIAALVCGAACMALTGCGGGGGFATAGGGVPGGGTGGGGTGGTGSDRAAVIAAVQTKYAALSGQDPYVDAQAMLDFLKQQPGVTAGDLSGVGTVWYRTSDGLTSIVGDELDSTPYKPTRALVRPSGRAHGRSVGVPGSDRVRVINTLGPSYDAFNDDLQKYFDHEIYQVNRDNSVDGLKQINGEGALYLLSHASPFVTKEGKQSYAVWTGTDHTAANDTKYADDLADGSLINYTSHYYDGDDNHRVIVTRYGITEKFVKKYWAGKLDKNSFVWVNACSSDSGPSAGFKSACLAAGASVYAGWTERVRGMDAGLTAEFLIDRLLGANMFDDAEHPEQRPFDWESLKIQMRGKTRIADQFPYDTSLNRQNNFASKLLFTKNAGGFGLFVPSIAWLDLDEVKGQLTVNGIFGPDKGFVTVGGTDAEILTWTDNRIVCNIPLTGPGSNGDVTVTVSGHQSNARQLTDWRGQFICKHTDGGLHQTTTFDVHFRADLQDMRLSPGEKPGPGSATRFLGFTLARDSHVLMECGGTDVTSNGSSTTKVTWTGGGRWDVDIPATDPHMEFSGGYDPFGHVVMARLLAYRSNALHVHTVTTDSQGHVTTFDDDTTPSAGFQPTLTVNPDFSIAGGTQVLDSGSGVKDEWSWETMHPNGAPDPNGGRAATVTASRRTR